MIVKFRNGSRVLSPANPVASWPIFETLVDDQYHLSEWEYDPPTTILDIGAHIGCASVRFAGAFRGASIFSYEPNPGTARYLRANVQLNGLDVEVIEAAIGSDQGFAEVSGEALSGNATVKASEVGVPVVSLAGQLGQHSAGRVLVKLDCEGAEYAALEGTQLDDWTPVEWIILEYHPVAGRGGWDEIKKRLGSFGFVPKWHFPDTQLASYGLAMFVRIDRSSSLEASSRQSV